MVAQAQFSEIGLSIAPGEEATATVTVSNLGDRTETYSMVPAGMTAAWVKINPVTITLFPGATERVNVTVRPPRQASTTAGSMSVVARAVAQSDPDDIATAELPLTVQAFDARAVHILQPVQRAGAQARYEVIVENQGNSHASCRLHLVDLTGRVDGEFDPPSVGVEPGGSALTELRVKAVGRRWSGGSRFLVFRVEASQQGHDTVHADATLVQTPVFHARLLSRAALALGAVAAVLAGWFGVVRPALDDAASSAVDDRLAELTPASASAVDSVARPSGATVPADGAGPEPAVTSVSAEGDLFTARLAKDVGLGTTDGSTYTVPAGMVLRVTDVILQNPGQDAGRAVLLRNSDPTFEWALGNIFGNESLPIVTPIQFPAGDNLTFQVTCDGFNDVTRGACTASLTLIGRLVPS